ncbi:polyprenyl diphosphate synthase [Candidatus Thioglobus sp.]|jgi:undecaprenyl diphosphate synthase|uniref:polyprenyl diphosphate synthase n=1 Tax=Candidatus Thioglobus sp. TaxID=2026721 RepID=UPI001D7C23F6|nr:polyprenyl diphosphate synthase [Candidatus Thioglobus sp.]MBT3276469.1 di-trans,poly-cis-decaprenylcistransferase [Candidatus Thioglobus sp.]MBT3447038.1 di-trans,poly-cis-decaprenylcistransferase [Candidatus Thioglobus sp.]MBT3745220.1 di-trans,poly-cis-decaprenylcistransferase [Candidatus Thioglobus sp.]MBT4000530.1 di-trans,poly-cis-decaprenylcistransferase [Candidatus Thioglobus sp.]MBT4181668.1 di-trans,poly-cis-decaprenylcistransferase [Candidatus Thioglobus sp.]
MNIPKHIAIIMDGNGRWASGRSLPRIVGHQQGVKAVRTVVKACGAMGVKTLTLFAFSSENKNRSTEEVSLLFKLFLTVLKQEVKKLNKHNVRLKIIGDLSLFPEDVQKTAAEAQTLLDNNNGLTLVIAANYGGQWDIVQAARQAAQAALNGDIKPEDITIDSFSNYLSLANEPMVDLLIRSSGELRISNFLLWDVAYSEFYFTDTLWPDFDETELNKAIVSFNHRDRRFGARKEK